MRSPLGNLAYLFCSVPYDDEHEADVASDVGEPRLVMESLGLGGDGPGPTIHMDGDEERSAALAAVVAAELERRRARRYRRGPKHRGEG